MLALVDWLRNESEKLMGHAISRRECASTMRNATTKELREAKALAERMAGRKLKGVKTDRKSTIEDAEMQCRISSKMEAEARQLAAWADEIAGEESQAPSTDL